MLKLNLNAENSIQDRILSRIENIYDRIAGDDDYRRNESSLRLIQFCVITASAAATGYVNAFAHKERIGWLGGLLLAALITGFVEKFYFTLRHGLTTIYKSGAQRFIASLCYRVIQGTMILNGAVLCAWVVGTPVPHALEIWNRWSIAIHFTLALIGVAAVRETDAVVANRILELKSEAAKQDILTVRKAAALGSPLVLIAAKIRGFLDGAALARDLLTDKSGLSSQGGQVGQWSPGGVGKDIKEGGQTAQVISLFAAHPVPPLLIEAETAAGVGNEIKIGGLGSLEDLEGGQIAEWIKTLLPKSQSGWWEVAPKGKGLSVKLRWRDPERQTLLFSQISSGQIELLRKHDSGEVSKILGEQITLQLRSLSSDLAKRDKVLIAAQRLGIDLDSAPAVNAAKK